MTEEIKTLNIPDISVNRVVELLCSLYGGAVKKGVPFKNIPSVFLWGPAGVGKSNGVLQIAEKLSKLTGRNVCVTDVRLLLFSPIDLRGVPVADEKKEFTNWLKPRIFDMKTDENTVNLLFLDELSAAPQSVQAAAYQICLDRRIGEHLLPENCLVIAAGNRTTDLSVSYKMPKALCNRLLHFNIKTDFESWREWAYDNNIDPRIIGYLGFDNSRLCVEPESSELAFCTPRSWSFVSTILEMSDDTDTDTFDLIAACIGTDAALEFETWCRGYLDLPSIEEIFRGTCRRYPRSNDVYFALISSLYAAIRNKSGSVTDNELENCCSYVKRFPADFAMTFFKDLNSIDGMRLRLMKCPSMQEWISKNKRFL